MWQNSEQKQAEKTESPWKSVKEWIQVIAIALAISLPIRFFVAEPFVVNGASMDPTFSTGQFLIVDRLTYHFEQPKRNDVIIFQYPNNPNIYYIKRIIGLPGETIDIKNGKITIINAENPSGFVLDESYIKSDHASYDTLHLVLNTTQYFVMGDNRAQSSDSRVWGPLESHFIVGRPVLRLLPVNMISIFPGKYEVDQQ
jgi:signal peptidase I